MAAAPVHDHFRHGARADTHLDVLRAKVAPEETQLRADGAVISKGQNEKTTDVIPPWFGFVGFGDFIAGFTDRHGGVLDC